MLSPGIASARSSIDVVDPGEHTFPLAEKVRAVALSQLDKDLEPLGRASLGGHLPSCTSFLPLCTSEMPLSTSKMPRSMSDVDRGMSDMDRGIFDIDQGISDVERGIFNVDQGISDVDKGIFDVERGIFVVEQARSVLQRARKPAQPTEKKNSYGAAPALCLQGVREPANAPSGPQRTLPLRGLARARP